MRARVLPAVAALVLLIACGDSKHDQSTRRRQSATSTSVESSGNTPSPSEGSGSPPTGAAAGAPQTTAATRSLAPPTTTNATGSRTATGSAAPSGTSSASATAKPTGTTADFAASGRYTYDVTGTLTFGTPPQQRPTNGQATLTVDPPNGHDQHSALASEEGSTDQTLRAQPDSYLLVDLKLNTPAFNKEYRPAQPQLVLPRPPTAGRTWSWQGTTTDGKTTVVANFRLDSPSTVTVGTEAVSTAVLHLKLTLSGDVTATVDQTSWVSDKYHLPVQQHSVADGTFLGVPFHADTTGKLRSTKPGG